MRFRIYRNKHGMFYAKRHLFWFIWISVIDGYTEYTEFKQTKEEMTQYIYDRYLPTKEIYSKDELVQDFRI